MDSHSSSSRPVNSPFPQLLPDIPVPQTKHPENPTLMSISSLALTAILCVSSARSPHPKPPASPLRALSPTISPCAGPAEWNYPIRGIAIRRLGTIGPRLAPALFASICAATSQFLAWAIGAHQGEDALIPDGMFVYTEYRTHMMIELENANNHQLSWKVVKAAVDALTNVPESERSYQADFKDFDGVNQVGSGILTRMRS